MARKVTIFTGQWADLSFEETAKLAKEMGYDGLESCCWGDHFDVFAAAKDKSYCDKKREILAKYDLGIWAISNHLAGQLTCDPNNDERSDGFGAVPANLSGNAEGKREWAIIAMKACGPAAKNLGVKVVNGFMGSPIWHCLYSFPPVSAERIEAGFRYVADTWKPILDIYQEYGVKFALEVHPTEIAFDTYTAERLLEALDYHPAFGFNFDPSHLIWQGVSPVRFINRFSDRIFHVHMKDAAVRLDGDSSILGSHFDFGDNRRGWNFRSLGHGDVQFDDIIRALNDIGYDGPLSVEWEDSGMDRVHGGTEAAAFVRKVDFAPSNIAFDAQFSKK